MTTPTDFLDEDVRKQVAKELGRYVYMLVDPRDGIPFYVSKGQDLHLDAHEREIDFDDEGQHKNDQNSSGVEHILISNKQKSQFKVQFQKVQRFQCDKS